MAIELRPAWCLADEGMNDLVTFGHWFDDQGTIAVDRDGDDWKPGEPLRLRRKVALLSEPMDLRRSLGLRAGADIGLAVRWSCRSTALAGVHTHGPRPVALAAEVDLDVEIPPTVAGAVELETCVIVSWPGGEVPENSAPDGGLVWSDGWTAAASERTVLLEGSEVRIPVRNVSFSQRFGAASSALWAIDIDPSVEADDLVANVVTVLLNSDVLERDFVGNEQEPDPSLIPNTALAGVSVDLVRSLTATLLDDLEDSDHWSEFTEGSVGAMLSVRLSETFDTLHSARQQYLEDQAGFSRELWSRFAPDSWKN